MVGLVAQDRVAGGVDDTGRTGGDDHLLYGIGSALVEEPIGLALIMVNSVAVAVAGVIGHRVVGSQYPIVGAGYLTGRVAEAVLLAGGAALYAVADLSGADNTGYLLGMLALAIGSVPFCRALGRGQWLPSFLARWGMVGYAALAGGALLELTTGRAVAIIFSIPGGLFEVALGLFLLRRGFGPVATVKLGERLDTVQVAVN